MISSLVSQVETRLEADIRGGLWREWLPAERVLMETLSISRKTLRKALARLRQGGLIETRHGLGHRILMNAPDCVPEGKGREALQVALLSPEPVEALRPYTALWVAELGAMLAAHGCTLRVVSGKKYFSRTPAVALKRLVVQYPRHCWILSHTHAAMQRWFALQGMPCIVTGSCHAGVELPSIDQDHRAVCRHAAGVFRSHGHRRLAMLTEHSDRAGDLESETGFAEGAGLVPGEPPVVFLRHDGSPAHACRLLDRLLAQRPAPTGLLVAQPLFYITAVTHLAARGMRIPLDLSVMCRDDDTFLDYAQPVPARYVCTAKNYAKKLLKAVLATAAGDASTVRPVRIFPSYVPGGSIRRITDGECVNPEMSAPAPSVRSSSRARRLRDR